MKEQQIEGMPARLVLDTKLIVSIPWVRSPELLHEFRQGRKIFLDTVLQKDKGNPTGVAGVNKVEGSNRYDT